MRERAIMRDVEEEGLEEVIQTVKKLIAEAEKRLEEITERRQD